MRFDRLTRALFETAPDDHQPRPAPPQEPPVEEHSRVAEIRRRVATIPTADLPGWLEQLLSSAGHHMHAFLKDWDFAHLEEMKLVAPSVEAIVDELERRHADRIEAANAEAMGVVPRAWGTPER